MAASVTMLLALLLTMTAADCAECHRDKAAALASSRHATAAIEPVYAVSFKNSRSPWCLECHQPDRKTDGLTCLSCHAVQGDKNAIRGPHAATLAEDPQRHRIVVEPALSTKACAACHEFNAPTVIATEPWIKMTDLPMQRTMSETQEWSAGAKCTQCHDPHTPRGGHDAELLKKTLRFTSKSTAQGTEVEVRAIGTGHRFPTGDVFRRLVIDVCDEVSCTKVKGSARLGAKLELTKGLWAPQFDDTLRDGETRVFQLPKAKFWRARFFFGNADFEAGLAAKDIFVDVASGEVR